MTGARRQLEDALRELPAEVRSVLQTAMALDPSNVAHFVESLREREQIAIGDSSTDAMVR